MAEYRLIQETRRDNIDILEADAGTRTGTWSTSQPVAETLARASLISCWVLRGVLWMSGNGRVVDANEIGDGDGSVSGSDIERQIEQRRTIVGLEDNLAASAQLENQADIKDPRRLDPGSGETVAFVPGKGVQVVSEGAAPTADSPSGGQDPAQQQPQQPDQPSQQQPDRQSGSGIGPGGVEGSEEAVPREERDAPQNDSTEGINSDQTGRVEEGQGIDIPEIVDEQDAISATEIGGETGVSGSDIEQAVASGRPITDIEDSPAVAAQLENQFGIKGMSR